jgi:hypothetical protein
LIELSGFDESLYPNEENALMDELAKARRQIDLRSRRDRASASATDAEGVLQNVAHLTAAAARSSFVCTRRRDQR